MQEKDLILRKIANALYLNVQHIPTDGLLKGKLGIVLFLYHYADYSKQDHYSDFADSYLDYLYDTISARTPLTFSEGLAGIGWVFHHLITEQLIEGDSDDVLEEIDNAIETMELNLDLQADIPLFSPGIYFLKRGKQEIVRKLIYRLDTFISDTNYFSPSYLNSVLYFVKAAYVAQIEKELCMKMLVDVVQRMQILCSEKRISVMERDIYCNYLKEIESLGLITPLQILAAGGGEHQIQASWSGLCYAHNPLEDVSMKQIDGYVNEKIHDLHKSDLLFYGGLPGLGSALMF